MEVEVHIVCFCELVKIDRVHLEKVTWAKSTRRCHIPLPDRNAMGSGGCNLARIFNCGVVHSQIAES